METFSALLAGPFEGNPTATGGVPSQRAVTRNFNIFFDLHLNKRLNITHYDVTVMKGTEQSDDTTVMS